MNPSRLEIHNNLKNAVENKDFERVQTLLRQELWLVNRFLPGPVTLLALAAQKGFVEIARLLLDAKANANQQCFHGKTPLILASSSGHCEMVQLLLAQPETIVDLADDYNQTALHRATTNSHEGVVKLLLEANASTKSLNSTRITVLNDLKEAVETNDVPTVQSCLNQYSLLANRVCDGVLRDSFLYRAASGGFVEMAQALIEAKADVNQQCSKGRTPLLAAVINGHAEIVVLLLAQAELVLDLVDDTRQTALSWAAARASTAMVRHLLDAQCSVDGVSDSGDTALLTAGCNHHWQVVQLLLQRQHAPDIINHRNTTGVCILYLAAQQGRDEIAAALLKAKAVVDRTVVGNGDTPLMAAAASGHESAVLLLLAANANVHHCSTGLETALHRASANGHAAVVVQLLRASASINAVTKRGSSALTFATQHGDINCVSLLLDANADINLADANRCTPLLLAIKRGNVKVAKLLLDSGANVLTGSHRSARQLARDGNWGIQALFRCWLCGWEGMCCLACRKKYCVKKCDKKIDHRFKTSKKWLDCRLHRKVAHQAVVEWTLAMSSLQLPPYVVEHIFNSLKLNSTEPDYQKRKAVKFLWISPSPKKLHLNFVHLIVEERSHLENIQLFIAIQKFKVYKGNHLNQKYNLFFV